MQIDLSKYARSINTCAWAMHETWAASGSGYLCACGPKVKWLVESIIGGGGGDV